ncbi:DUF3786 domain-containing protein [Dethiosulfatarculus sandiegensis]|uniref:DUF3786 domain-containing protein n=1 Tax=Dethiosulfatarculus sandiegensis TaxID=1429043 RepID=A0A0D2J4V5_9BACT|nr:DUF3786 domain-containing protein [Dethiosulfatarculus sandiegensis]KIX10756.1 hypothetical protein X474_27935 [Dethiosulfatarculus sandiegensis]
MFDSEKPQVYEKVFQELSQDLAKADFSRAAQNLGLVQTEQGLLIPLLGHEYLVGKDQITGPDTGTPPINHRIVLVHLVLISGRGEVARRFVPYRELPGGQDFARSLAQLVETPLAAHFSGRLNALFQAAEKLHAEAAPPEVRADAAFQFQALPKLPMMLTFYDADEDFGAECKVFYDLTAPNFLDLECLAALSGILTYELIRADKNETRKKL